MDKIRLNKLRWSVHLIRMGEDDPAQKIDKGNIIIEKEELTEPGSQTAFMDIELIDVVAKSECLELLTKASLDWMPVVATLMMTMNETHYSRMTDEWVALELLGAEL